MELIPLLLLIIICVALLAGYPVALTLGGTSILFALICIPFGIFDPTIFKSIPIRIFGIMNNVTLLAVPLFIFMGTILEKSGIAASMLKNMALAFRSVKGGLSISIIVVGALLAASTGIVGATVVTMGLMSLPILINQGYDISFSAGLVASTGTLGQIIPPSIVLVVLGDQLGISVGDLFLGSLIPGILMASAFATYVLIISALKPEVAPQIDPIQLEPLQLIKLVLIIIPPLGLILVVLGSIFFGIATPTEAGTLGAVGAMGLATMNGGFSRKALSKVCDETLRTTSMVMAILLGSTAFSLVFRGVGGDELIANVLVNLPGGKIGFMAFSMLIIFFLGFFIDFFEIAFIAVPLLLPAARQLLGPEALLWLGVVIGANLQTSFLTPPFGFALFYLRGVAPNSITTQEIYRGVLPFVALQICVLCLIIIAPALVNWLPTLSWS